LALSIDSNGSKYILRGDIASSMNDSDFSSGNDGLYFTVISSEGTANNNTYSGANSAGTTVADGETAVNYNYATKMTVGAGTLTVTAASDKPTSAQLVALSTNNAIAKWKLVAANESVEIKKFRVGLTTGSAGEDEVARIALYEGSTLLAETYSFAGGYTEFNIDSLDFIVEPGSGNARYLTVRVDLNSTSDTVLDSGATLAAVLIDLEAWGATAEVAPYSGSTADGFAFADSAKNVNEGDTFAIDDVTLTMEASHGILAGDIIRVESEQMYVSAVSTNDLTVVRAFNGTAAATHADASDVYVARSIEGNNFKVYGNKLSISDPSSKPSGTLAAWSTYTSVFKFKLVPDANATEEAVLNSVKISLAQASGIGATAASDWYITDAALYNGDGTKIAEMTGETIASDGTCGSADALCASTDYIRFDASTVSAKNGSYTAGNRLSEAIAAAGEEYTVKVKIGGAVATNDSLQMSIASLGAVATAGDLDWDDSVSANVTWVDMGTVDSYTGNAFTK
jgi:hypothetical protein